jgi:hypothetical protein
LKTSHLSLLCLFFVFSISAIGKDIVPPGVTTENNHFVFIDILSAKYEMTFDVLNQKAFVKTTLKFKTFEMGKPLFDLVEEAKDVSLDNFPTTAKKLTLFDKLDPITELKYVDLNVEPGEHTLSLTSEIKKNLDLSNNQVKYFQDMSDLDDRRFLEQYLPTNLQYDQYSIVADINITGSLIEHSLITNGTTLKLGVNHWEAKYPKFYNCSSMYFHIINPKNFKFTTGTYKSIDGFNRSIFIYTKEKSTDLPNILFKTNVILSELERDYGAWPHNEVIIYITSPWGGGMEYAGATATAEHALGHELHHSYFARSAQPANGNSSWIDEALASWRDNGYNTSTYVNQDNLGAHSVYQRITDMGAYSNGARLIAYLDYKLKAKGGMKPALKSFYHDFAYQIYSTSDFIFYLEDYFNEDLSIPFNTTVFGNNSFSELFSRERSTHIRPYTAQEVKALL